MKYVIFYSWQSDLPNNTNRGFIEDVIAKSFKSISSEHNFELEPTIDKDTLGIPGSPDISTSIIEKIKNCDAFVADISIVTRKDDSDHRLSPNPNVLIELGYAIALLGWDKIILFCNEHYGPGEKLPFDIRQHRRIPYKLAQEDSKEEIRKQLTNIFQRRLVELLEAGKNIRKHKTPELLVEWNVFEDSKVEKNGKSNIAKELLLSRAQSVEEYLECFHEAIEDVRNTNAGSDPDWEKTKAKFLYESDKFISELNEREKYIAFLIKKNRHRLKKVAISVSNIGTSSATDVRIEISLPSWLIVKEKLPEFENTPIEPDIPKPATDQVLRRLIAQTAAEKFLYPIESLRLVPAKIEPHIFSHLKKRTFKSYIKDGQIKFWADKILHKHSVTNLELDSFYLLANADAPVGTFSLEANIFCHEFDDWKNGQITIVLK